MNLAVVGLGRVGLVAAAALSDFGHNVVGVDIDQDRVRSLQQAKAPFYEPGLAEMLQKNCQAHRLRFSTDLGEAVRLPLGIFLALGTEEISDGTPNLSALFEAAEQIVRQLDQYRALFIKSTVPVGTAARLREHLRPIAGADFDLVSNPEFLREGSAIENFLRPDRIIVGTTNPRARRIAEEVYRPLYLRDAPLVIVDHETAELIKYASNAFLALKITFINEMATLCEACGADVHAVARAMGMDKRIGPKFLHPGPGFGGSCLPKDARSLVAIANRYGCRTHLAESLLASNAEICSLLISRLRHKLGGLPGRTVCVLGLAYKPFTDDVRESPAVEFARQLAAGGAVVRAHDPVANASAARVLSQPAISFHDSPVHAAEGAEALVVLTDWNEFRSLDLEELRSRMKGNVLLDTRNIYRPDQAIEKGFDYMGRGRGSVPVAASVGLGV